MFGIRQAGFLGRSLVTDDSSIRTDFEPSSY
jgi:hypothetical protein